MTRKKRIYKNCGNHLPAFYTLLDTNLQEPYRERRGENETQAEAGNRKKLHPFFFFTWLLLVY
jgi:hypothetical protein